MKKEYKQSVSSSNLNKINTLGYLTQYVVLPLKSENKLPEEHFKWRDIMDVRDLYYSKPCRPIRIKPYDDHPILNDATRDFLSSWDKQGLKLNEYARVKYDWLKSQDDDWYHPSQTVVMPDRLHNVFWVRVSKVLYSMKRTQVTLTYGTDIMIMFQIICVSMSGYLVINTVKVQQY